MLENTSLGIVLTALGAVSAVYLLVNFLSVAYLFLRRSSLPASLHPSKQPYLTYALVTGSTDGIGLALAHELARRGFALVLHGRSPAKLARVAAGIQAAFPDSPYPKFLVADADKCSTLDFDALVAPLRRLRLTVLANNIGAMGHLSDDPFRTLQAYAREDMDRLLDLNLTFMAHLTRALLPVLLRASDPAVADADFDYPVPVSTRAKVQGAPTAQILNASSAAALGVPYVVPYAGAKGFVGAFTAALKSEFQAERLPPSRIDVLCLRIGSVVTATNPVRQSIWAPSAAVCARAICERVGCGRDTIEPYFGHWLQVSFFSGLAGERFRRWGIVMNARWVVQQRQEEREQRLRAAKAE